MQEAQYLSCQPCPIGTFSEQFDDALGVAWFFPTARGHCKAGRMIAPKDPIIPCLLSFEAFKSCSPPKSCTKATAPLTPTSCRYGAEVIEVVKLAPRKDVSPHRAFVCFSTVELPGCR